MCDCVNAKAITRAVKSKNAADSLVHKIQLERLSRGSVPCKNGTSTHVSRVRHPQLDTIAKIPPRLLLETEPEQIAPSKGSKSADQKIVSKLKIITSRVNLAEKSKELHQYAQSYV
jgi:hypothetical protein